ncbi:hypothetical protein P4278_06430 [Bacillus thuringiensis]|nr:hypothetical protein [Bacillus thuringiensis]MED2756082.1 hypothetical protein [Bacillus thuringiensis]MED2766462.1 hypothetical protein [Bacillus thuringiensis]MED2773488.1 hypothetical protein [Bacillus thuringiensis]MED2779370.1 hypothetical protein [Bacillus thuringiensis]
MLDDKMEVYDKIGYRISGNIMTMEANERITPIQKNEGIRVKKL